MKTKITGCNDGETSVACRGREPPRINATQYQNEHGVKKENYENKRLITERHARLQYSH